MKKVKAIRHGDLCLVQIRQLPKGLTPSATQTLMQGSGGNNHDVRNGAVYFTEVDQFIFGYLAAGENCQLLHPDHGCGRSAIKTADIPAGVYELRRQFEYQHESMTQVLD